MTSRMIAALQALHVRALTFAQEFEGSIGELLAEQQARADNPELAAVDAAASAAVDALTDDEASVLLTLYYLGRDGTEATRGEVRSAPRERLRGKADPAGCIVRGMRIAAERVWSLQ